MASSLFDMKKLKDLGGYNAGALIAVDPELYSKFMKHLTRFVKKDSVTKNIVFLTALSAYTPCPSNLFLRGESSIGKTYNVVETLKYFPKDDVWLLGGLSPTALIHSRGKLVDEHGEEIGLEEKPLRPRKTDYADNQGFWEALKEYKEQRERWRKRLEKSRYLVDLTRKILVFLEAPNIKTFNMLRPILSHDSHEISYKFTDKTSGGKLRTQHVVLQGFPATIFCTTQETYLKDLATRCFTVTPEMTPEKYKAANLLTATKAAFPWMFDDDRDLEELQSYIRFLKHKLDELRIVVPYGHALAQNFPSAFPRSMRDLPHLVNLMKVSAYFHFAQRPVLIRKVKQHGGEEKREEVYVVASENDYRRVMELWSEIRETTETSAPGHIIKFFHQVVLKLAEEKDEFAIEDLTQAWNNTSENRKSSKAIRNWVRFLSDVGYLTSMPDPNDKRRKLISVIKDFKDGKNAEYGLSDLCAIFSLDSLKEWLSTANNISLQNQVLLQEKSFGSHETSVQDIYKNHFRKKTVSAGDISKNNEQPSLHEKTAEKTQNSKKPHSALFTFQNFKQLTRLTTPVRDKCTVCGFQGRMDWQITMPDGSWSLLCGKCGLKLAELAEKT